MMENIVVIIIVALAAGLLGRNYYKKYKKDNQCSSGCNCCSADTSSCEFPEERVKQVKKQSPADQVLDSTQRGSSLR